MSDNLQSEYAGLVKKIRDTKEGDARRDLVAAKGDISKRLDKQLGRKGFKAFVAEANAK